MSFLNGNCEPIRKLLEERMNEAAERMDFEAAIEQRELLKNVQQIAQKQKITDSGGEDKDVVALMTEENDAVVQMFFIRGGRMIGRDHFFLRVAPHDTKSVILSSFLKQFYAGTPFIPKEVMLPEEIEDAEIIEEWLTKKRGQRGTHPGAQKRDQGKACGIGGTQCGDRSETG